MELGSSIIVPYTIQTCDGGSHRRKDRLNGGIYITDGAASMALSTMQPNETITSRGEALKSIMSESESDFLHGSSVEGVRLSHSRRYAITSHYRSGSTRPVTCGFKAGQSPRGRIAWRVECAQTIAAGMSAIEPTVVVSAARRPVLGDSSPTHELP